MENYTFDLHRIFFGDLPALFLVEIVFRTSFLFLYTVVLIRLSPHRNMGQLTLLEWLVIIAFGSAMGDPTLYPNVPLVHGMLVIVVILGTKSLLVHLTRRSDRMEQLIEGEPVRLVVDGKLDLDGMQKAHMTRMDVFMEVRLRGYRHLGQIERAYMEISGKVSVYSFSEDDIRQGFRIIPPDSEANWSLYTAGEQAPQSQPYVCFNCAQVQHHEQGNVFGSCQRCDKRIWADAVSEQTALPDPSQSSSPD